MRIKKTPQKFVHCDVCNLDLNSLTMYHRHITTIGHQQMSREEDTFKAWLTLYKERVLLINANFRLIPTPNQELSQIPILKAFDFFSVRNAPVNDMMWSTMQSGFLLMGSQYAADFIASLASGTGNWGKRLFLDDKNWIVLKTARTFTDAAWQEIIDDLEWE